ncbi:GTPase-associated system all-helical protein GASH [Metapseudomonas otitidis]|uniref:GTPase-associated system all-helical protein GASH n=1 Tax=Metapseudomonas otitidis TaxID=319939 RepID=UPI003216BB2A
MSLMAKHSRIFWPDPQDEQVRRLNLAVAEVQIWIRSLSPVSSAIEFAAVLARAFESGTVDDKLAQAVEKSIVKSGSDAFVREGNDLQIAVVAVVAALDLVRKDEADEDGWGIIDAFAAACWSALSFQSTVEKEGLEVLRAELLSASRERVAEVAEKSRVRATVPEVGLLHIPDSTPANARSKTAFRTAVEPLVKSLRENAELDREEIDFLWWRLSDWSDILEKPLSSLSPINRAVYSALECGSMLRRPPSSGHRNVALQGISNENSFTLAQVVSELEVSNEKLQALINTNDVTEASEVYPLLNSILSGDVEAFGSTIPRTTRDWGARALLESSVLQLNRRKGS